MSPVLAQDGGGSVSIADAALAQVVAQAVESVEGARLLGGRRRTELELARGRARASLTLAIGYGRVLPEVAGAVQERVAEALRGMCGVEVTAVDVTVEELDR
ncbi:MAG TPA: Asp23/Gls24 family envelope stress response protein [Gaiellaceae bacterium]|nr:Asp23/Gls24 family envelope stress response protein [Gaiellaceae bacterium]